jgi:hypothetical protein
MVEVKHHTLPNPAQHQDRRVGLESEIAPQPQYLDPVYHRSEKLKGKVALITPLRQNSCRLKFLEKIKFEIRDENLYKIF